MTAKQDDRPTMNLGHLAIPHESASQDWLRRQGEKRRAAVEIVAAESKKWWAVHALPDSFYEQFAERIVTALDQRL
ncbi:hypothetical protein EV284_3516 [Streptomyces sp. BK022]|uniref:hypothetical protein n=1 Tax=Streptomyces sp. BK022 TaxID=2512123 RepID=UPI00102A1BA4|nr:hypothetical protein [Streptomyces sp. BK022]RZU36033.1 hypothetical protein EV284_3516 [Streptomyces sp. BK022]